MVLTGDAGNNNTEGERKPLRGESLARVCEAEANGSACARAPPPFLPTDGVVCSPRRQSHQSRQRTKAVPCADNEKSHLAFFAHHTGVRFQQPLAIHTFPQHRIKQGGRAW